MLSSFDGTGWRTDGGDFFEGNAMAILPEPSKPGGALKD